MQREEEEEQKKRWPPVRPGRSDGAGLLREQFYGQTLLISIVLSFKRIIGFSFFFLIENGNLA